MGYLASLVYTFLEALTLQMSTLLYQKHGISPGGIDSINKVRPDGGKFNPESTILPYLIIDKGLI